MLQSILNAIIALIRGPMSAVELEVVLNKLGQEHKGQGGERLDWHNSIVDLLKLLNLDSSTSARMMLWGELGNSGDYTGTTAQNLLLHRQVMKKVGERGIKVPAHG